MVFHLVTGAVTLFMFYTAAPGSDLFSWHPTLMTISFCLLMSQAIAIFSPESSLLHSSERKDKVQLHWILNLFALLAGAGGFGAIYLNKEIVGKKHFTTWHGLFGLITCIGVLVAAAGGIIAKYNQYVKDYIRPINVKLYHATGSMIVFSLAMVTICLACYSNWFKNRVDGYLWRCMFWSPIVLMICVARQVTQSYLPRVVKPTPQVEKKKSQSSTKEVKSQ